MITHYKRLLDYVEPDRIHVLQDGRIVQSGDKHLAAELERSGYGTFAEAPEAAEPA
jgi:Fe-S cluster assembly ATP-binding protein